MADVSPSRKRSNPPTPKKSPLASRGVQIGIVLLVVIIAAVAVWAVYPRSPATNDNNATFRYADFHTSMGDFKVELFQHKMPITVANFIRLADSGFYNGMIFHRIGDNFMIQSGGYLANGTQKVSPFGQIAFEDQKIQHFNGTISMASTGAKVGGSSQFFICDGAQPSLDNNYAAFGIVTENLSLIHEIASQPHDNSNGDGTGKPLTDIVIYSITIE